MGVACKRSTVRQLQDYGLSERRALRYAGISASTLRYTPRTQDDALLRERLHQLAQQHKRNGYRMLHNRLRMEGWDSNVKRIYRIYREESLMVRQREKRKLSVSERQPLTCPQAPNEIWSMDFIFDELANGRRIKNLTIVDDCSKEAIGIVADTSIPAVYVIRVLEHIKQVRSLPKVIRTDNGPEFAGRVMQKWIAENHLEHRFIQPGKPMQNAFIESFNGRLRDECLSVLWFANLRHMRSILAGWQADYNHKRPHSALGYTPPAVYAAQHVSSSHQQVIMAASPKMQAMQP